jgi:hypothetical protein
MLLNEQAPGATILDPAAYNMTPGGLPTGQFASYFVDNMESVGLSARGGTLAEAMQTGQPFMALTDTASGHALVVQGVDSMGNLIIRDPLYGSYWESPSSLDVRLMYEVPGPTPNNPVLVNKPCWWGH